MLVLITVVWGSARNCGMVNEVNIYLPTLRTSIDDNGTVQLA